jgi:chaperonin GroES
MHLAGKGDKLAAGAKSATFAAGGAKRDDPIQINPGITATASEVAKAAREKTHDQKQYERTSKKIRKMAPVTPMYDNVLIRPLQPTLESNVIVVETEKDTPMEGTVVAVGFGRLVNGDLKPLYLKGGEHVMYGKYSGQEVKYGDGTVLMMREDEILGIINDAIASNLG